MSPARIFGLTLLSMMAFAGNSLLCRAALLHTNIDAASFTSIRLISGAVMLWLIVRYRHARPVVAGNWPSAIALFVYAAGFSFAYITLSTATGALLLFSAVQATMIGYGIYSGERLRILQFVGLLLAFSGLIIMLLPGLSAPPLPGAIMMLSAGVAWGIYSLYGKGVGDPTEITTGNFLRAVVITLAMSLFTFNTVSFDMAGFWYAVASGALMSGMGYAIWYRVLPVLRATSAATVQLSVPVIAALGGIVVLNEPLTVRLVVATVAILGGIALVLNKSKAAEV